MRFLTTYAPIRNANSALWNDVDHFFGDLTKHWSDVYAKTVDVDFSPAVDVHETDTNFVLSLDVPGLKKDEIKIEASGDELTISGERKREKSVESTNKFQRSEKSYGFFKRSFTLPPTVDAESIEAKYDSGVLHLTLPKTAPAQARNIAIK